MEMHDLITPEEQTEKGGIKPGVPGPILRLSSQQLPEIADFSPDEDIEMHINAVVRKIIQPELKENETKSNEPTVVEIEVVEAGIVNLKPDRKEANRLGIDKRDLHSLKHREA